MNFSLHLGVNRYDTTVWGPDADLKGCVHDALNMAILAKKMGYSKSAILLDEKATTGAVIDFLKDAAKIVRPGETFLLSYSSHGAQVVDRSGEEEDGLDEVLCLHNGFLYDDELVSLLGRFEEGVMINVVSDTCHSQGQVRLIELPDAILRPKFLKTLIGGRERLVQRGAMKASVIQYASCLSTEVSWDTDSGGLFTKALLKIAGEERSRKSASFIDAIRRKVKNQTPTLVLNNASRAHRLKKALTP